MDTLIDAVVRLIPPEIVAWMSTHPLLTVTLLWLASSLLSSVPTTYKFTVPKIGLSIPVGYLVHMCIGNGLQVLRKVSPVVAGIIEAVLPGLRKAQAAAAGSGGASPPPAP